MLRYYDELLYYAQKLVGDKEKAKDIIQEAYIRVLESRDKYEIENQRAYLYKIAKNIVVKEALENQKLQTTLFEENLHFGPSCEQPEEIIFQEDQEKIFMQIIEELPQRAKEAYILHTIEGYSRTIPLELDLKKGTYIIIVLSDEYKLWGNFSIE